MLALALLALSEPLLPWLIKPLLDGSFVEGQAQHFTWVPILIVTLFVIRGLVSYAGSVQLHWVAHRVVMDLRREMFARLIGMPASFYDESSSGELISKFTYDVTQVREASTRVLNVLVNDTLTIVALVAFMVYLNWVLSLVVLAIGPLAGLVVIAISRRLREMSRRLQQSMGMITHVAQEAIEGQKPVKVFGGQDYELGRFGLAINAIRDDEEKAEGMGIHTKRYKTVAWSVAAFFLGIAGGIFGNMTGFVEPLEVAFPTITFGIFMVLMALLGGKGTLWGPVLGAALFHIIKEVTWTYLLGWQWVTLGALIIINVIFFQQGILGWAMEKWPAFFGITVEEDMAAEQDTGAKSPPAPAAPAS